MRTKTNSKIIEVNAGMGVRNMFRVSYDPTTITVEVLNLDKSVHASKTYKRNEEPLNAGRVDEAVRKAFPGVYRIHIERCNRMNSKKLEITLTTKDGETSPLKKLPLSVTDSPFLRPTKGLEGTVGDPNAVSVSVNGVKFPILRQQIREAVKLIIGEPPIVSELGDFEVQSVRVIGRSASTNEIKAFEFKYKKAGDPWKRVNCYNKVVLNALKDYLVPGAEFRLLTLGSLESGKPQVNVEDFNTLVDIPLHQWRVNKILEDGLNQDIDKAIEKARKEVIPAFNRAFEQEVLQNHDNLRITNVILDSTYVPKDKIGIGRSCARKLIRVINRIRMKFPHLGPVSIEDLTGLPINITCRYPIDSPTNVVENLTMVLLEDEVNALVVNHAILLGANGDADGDTFALEIMEQVVRELHHRSSSLYEVNNSVRTEVPYMKIVNDILVSESPKISDIIRAIPPVTEFKTPINKENHVLSVYEFEGVAPRDPLQVMIGLLSKHFTGLVTNGMNALSILGTCLGNTPMARFSVSRALGLEIPTEDLNKPMLYKTSITKAIKSNLILIDEMIMDVWKEFHKGYHASYLPELDTIILFLSSDNYMLPYLERVPELNHTLLNTIKRLGGGYAPTKAIAQWPIAASVILEPAYEAIHDAASMHGFEKVLKYLEGSEIEPKVEFYPEEPGVETTEILPYFYPPTFFGMNEHLNAWISVDKYVNKHSSIKISESELDLSIKFLGSPLAPVQLVVVPRYRIEPSKGCLLVKRGRSRRVSRLVATVTNQNAGRMINAGMPMEGCIPETRYETILDRFAYTLLTCAKEYDKGKIGQGELQNYVANALEKVYKDFTDVINKTTFETNVHHQRVSIELPKVNPRHLISTAEYLMPMLQDIPNPLTGTKVKLHFGLSNKNKPGESAGVYYDQLPRKSASGNIIQSTPNSSPIDLVAHILGGMNGVNQARHWKEAWTSRFSLQFVESGGHRMFNGWEDTLPELHAKSKDAVILIADMEGWLSYEGVTSDKGLITLEGQKYLKVIPRAKKTEGLRSTQLLSLCESITGVEGEESLRFAAQSGYTIIEDTRPLDRDAFTGEAIYEKMYTLIEPLNDADPSWLKLYFSGYKGIFVCIDQDFTVNVGGKREQVHAIMDSRTFAAKKMEAEYIAGALALRGRTHFFNQSVFGPNSLHEELLMKLMEENNETGVTDVYNSTGSVLGSGLVALFRTFVLRADPDYLAIKNRGFKATVDIMSLTQRTYDINRRVINELTEMAKLIFNK